LRRAGGRRREKSGPARRSGGRVGAQREVATETKPAGAADFFNGAVGDGIVGMFDHENADGPPDGRPGSLARTMAVSLNYGDAAGETRQDDFIKKLFPGGGGDVRLAKQFTT